MFKELPVEKLRRRCDLQELGCDASQQSSKLDTIIGQERAVQALRYRPLICQRERLYVSLYAAAALFLGRRGPIRIARGRVGLVLAGDPEISGRAGIRGLTRWITRASSFRGR